MFMLLQICTIFFLLLYFSYLKDLFVFKSFLYIHLLYFNDEKRGSYIHYYDLIYINYDAIPYIFSVY